MFGRSAAQAIPRVIPIKHRITRIAAAYAGREAVLQACVTWDHRGMDRFVKVSGPVAGGNLTIIRATAQLRKWKLPSSAETVLTAQGTFSGARTVRSSLTPVWTKPPQPTIRGFMDPILLASHLARPWADAPFSYALWLISFSRGWWLGRCNIHFHRNRATTCHCGGSAR